MEFLATGYSMGDWMRDPEVDRELRRSLLSWFTKSPYWQDDYALEQSVVSRLFECNGREDAIGLGVAALLNGMAISFLSDDIWNRTNIEVRVLAEILAEDNEATTLDEIVTVRHISNPNHLVAHQDWIEQSLAILPADGRELWERRMEWFPNLEFCSFTQLQLDSLEKRLLSPVTEHLASLQIYCENWISGPFDEGQFPPNRISTESAMTLQQYGHLRTFPCSDGQERTFSWHLKLTPAAWRIHFFPIPELKRMYIGYIGRHLKTVRYND